LASFAEVYGMPGESVDGNDLMAVRQAALKAVDYVRNGNGPALVVCDTYRWRGHSKSDRNRYRTKEEIEGWKGKDPIPRFRAYALEHGLLNESEMNTIQEQAVSEIEAARIFAENSPEPTLDTIEEGVYAPW
jgi:pyruvate dehydrogenase E1 component alpha subunit